MSEEPWRPLGYDDPESAGQYDVLHDGVPEWMAPGPWEWIEEHMSQGGGDGMGETPWWNRELASQMQRKCRLEGVLFSGWEVGHGMSSLRHVARTPDRQLQIADYLLSVFDDQSGRLKQVLIESSSAWTVGQRAGRPGLVRRVPEGVQTAAEDTMRSAGNAGRDLQEAWGEAFGREPNPSNSYRLAVRAVEHAAVPVVCPKDSGATLGKVIGVLRDQSDWALPMSRESADAPSGDVVLKMLQLLWRGHVDRHGGADDYTDASQEDAEVAVLAAVPLVRWFSSGAVRRQ